EWTWAQIIQEASDRAAYLATIEPADGRRQVHVGILMENLPDFVFWILGAGAAGAVIVGINSTRRGAELAEDIRHADCDLVFTEPTLANLLDGLDLGLPADRVVNIATPQYELLLAPHRGSALPAALPDPKDILLLLFSSGSTGAPKAVICTQGRLARLSYTMNTRVALTRESITYLCLPLFHGQAIMLNLSTALLQGATIAMTRKFSASGFVEDVHTYKPTFFNHTGRVLSYILAQPEDPRDKDSSLQIVFGTEASRSDVARFAARYGCEMRDGFGSSEGVLRINVNADTPEGALGVAMDGGNIEVRNEKTGAQCPRARFDEHGVLRNADEAIGQLVAVGQADRFEGYYKNPAAMADRVHGDDFWSGDLAYRDEEGYFYFAGRSSDWLRVDGENFSAASVERILARMAGVALALVFAVPDSRSGDQVMCALELEPGATFDPKVFEQFLDAQPDLGTKWRPRYVRIVDKVPITGNNKVNKAPLRHTAWETMDPVWWVPMRERIYRLLSAQDRAGIGAEFVDHGRQNLRPAPLDPVAP
ncbi:MAG: AMP-binding protein, partial [Jatrophihabitans sp.]